MELKLLEKLPERIQKRIKVQPSGCWFWTGRKDQSGYGRVQFEGRDRPAHRVVRHLTRKDIPVEVTPNTILDHEPHCGIRKCVNPYHNEAGTVSENLITSKHVSGITARTQVCKRGHDLSDPENVYVDPQTGSRTCKVCRNIRQKGYQK